MNDENHDPRHGRRAEDRPPQAVSILGMGNGFRLNQWVQTGSLLALVVAVVVFAIRVEGRTESNEEAIGRQVTINERYEDDIERMATLLERYGASLEAVSVATKQTADVVERVQLRLDSTRDIVLIHHGTSTRITEPEQ